MFSNAIIALCIWFGRLNMTIQAVHAIWNDFMKCK